MFRRNSLDIVNKAKLSRGRHIAAFSQLVTRNRSDDTVLALLTEEFGTRKSYVAFSMAKARQTAWHWPPPPPPI